MINANAKIGNNVRILHHVTIGINKVSGEAPVIEDGVTINSYAMILGKVVIGENSTIGAGSIVMHDIPPNTIYFNKRDTVIKQKHEEV